MQEPANGQTKYDYVDESLVLQHCNDITVSNVRIVSLVLVKNELGLKIRESRFDGQ